MNTLDASNKEDIYPFQTIFCHKSNNKRYIRSQTDNCNSVKVDVHSGHLQIQSDHIPNKIDHLDDAVHSFIQIVLRNNNLCPGPLT